MQFRGFREGTESVATSMYSKGPNCIQAYMQSPRAFTTLILNNASGNPDQQEKDVK